MKLEPAEQEGNGPTASNFQDKTAPPTTALGTSNTQVITEAAAAAAAAAGTYTAHAPVVLDASASHHTSALVPSSLSPGDQQTATYLVASATEAVSAQSRRGNGCAVTICGQITPVASTGAAMDLQSGHLQFGFNMETSLSMQANQAGTTEDGRSDPDPDPDTGHSRLPVLTASAMMPGLHETEEGLTEKENMVDQVGRGRFSCDNAWFYQHAHKVVLAFL